MPAIMAGACRFPPVCSGLLAAACLLLPAGCSPTPGDRTADPRPNVILITLDTVRAEHLGCYGYPRPTSPHIDAFAAVATRYAQAITTAPWTVPAHASLFTGKYPFEHGAHSLRVTHPAENNVCPLPLEHITLAEALQSEGYATGAFVANVGYLSPWTQLHQGFATYQVQWGYADRVNADVRPWLERNRNQPFFLFVNYMDAHRPYNTRPRPGFLDPPAVQDQGQLLDRLIEATLPGHKPPPDDLVQQVIDQYDTAIANLDEQIGVLLDWLRQLGLYDHSLIVLTSDHGEYFGEHGLVEHSKDVYQPALWVPLILKAPGQSAGQLRAQRISLAAVPGLVFAHLPDAIRRRHEATFALPPDAPVLAENYFSRTKDLFDRRWGARFDRVRTAIYDGPLKYIHSSDGRHELYNLQDDPAEARNLLALEDEQARRLARRLEAFQAARPRASAGRLAPGQLSAEQLRVLRSLGYLGTEDEGP